MINRIIQNYRIIIIIMILSMNFSVFAEEMLTITVKEGQTLRSIAQEYLENPNLWTEILKVNNLGSAAQVKPGMKLRIPASSVSKANRQLKKSLEYIEKATMNGAKLFAIDEISEAINIHDQAQVARNNGDWQACWVLANQAYEYSKLALDICMNNQNVPAQAVINYRNGIVQSRQLDSRKWSTANLHHILIEGDKVRTLSESHAGILFKDESRLRLEENSLAAIQKMRYNKLEDTEESSVSLLQGDIFAFLGGGRKKAESFDLDIQGVETEINSSQFWVSKEEDEAKFANYDGELSVSAGGKKVTMGVNQGSIISGGRASLISKLLPQPKLLSPGVFERKYGKELELSWEPIEGAQRYWLEVAHDKSFKNLVYSKKTISDTRFKRGKLDQDLYYWRVAAIDKHGLPGPKSEIRLAVLIEDNIAPYLVINTPGQGSVLRVPDITITGETEVNATVKIDNNIVEVDSAGQFRVAVKLNEGPNQISIVATDIAGNTTEQILNINYLPDNRKGSVIYDSKLRQIAPNHFLIQSNGFTLRGKTLENNRIIIRSSQSIFQASTFADEKGLFQISVPLSSDKEEFTITEEAVSGLVTEEKILVEVDNSAPDIHLDQPLPDVTDRSSLELSGNMGENGLIWINGELVDLSDEHFRATIEPRSGKNRIKIEARDKVDNLTIVEKEIIRDVEAPKIIAQNIYPDIVKGGERIVINVTVTDLSDVSRAAPYKIKVGGLIFEGFLVLNTNGKDFRGELSIPENVSGMVKLVSLTLEDYYGNRKEYKF